MKPIRSLPENLYAYLQTFKSLKDVLAPIKDIDGVQTCNAGVFDSLKKQLSRAQFSQVMLVLGMQVFDATDTCWGYGGVGPDFNSGPGDSGRSSGSDSRWGSGLVSRSGRDYWRSNLESDSPNELNIAAEYLSKGYELFELEHVRAVAINNPYKWTDFSKPVYFFVFLNQGQGEAVQCQAMIPREKELHDIEYLVSKAVEKGASDIHLYATTQGVQVWMRIEGVLVFYKSIMSGLIKQRIKYLANMDISVYTMPQDGRFEVKLAKGAMCEVRASSFPTENGENFVFRLFARAIPFDLDNLGFLPAVLSKIKALLKLESGLILVTGPTGSGKTTTLYSFLTWMQAQCQRHFMSIEDPVESRITGVQQAQVHAGFTFLHALKAMLRQDPDVIMVGEIRDKATAKMVIEAAYTGHLVFSTLHTSDCWSALSRLRSFELDMFLVNHCLKGVLSQKLLPNKENMGRRRVFHELLVLSQNHDNLADNWETRHSLTPHFLHSFEDDMKRKRV